MNDQPDTPETEPPASRAGSGTDAAFAREIAAFLQRRLVLVSLCLGVAALLLFVVSRTLDIAAHGFAGAQHSHPAVLVHAAATLTMFGLFAVLRRRALTAEALRVMDAVIAQIVVLTCWGVLWFSYAYGMRQQPAILGLLLVARAMIVPSPPLRTFVLSAPAAIGVLAIQLTKGEAYAYEGAPFPPEAFPAHVVWVQAALWLSVAIATLTSQVTYGLRRRLFEARRVDRYQLEERIGAGSMGEVWRARHALMRRPAALKILHPEIAGREAFARFEREVDLTTRLTHPNTVAIFDYGHTPDGLFYYAMEYIDGADLERIVTRTGAMPPGRAIHVLAQACASLAEAQASGLVHRDVKPANIMLCRRGCEDDVVKVMDFGLAHEAHRGDADDPLGNGGVSGTPLTMAPETIRGEGTGPAADVYALGVVGYYLLTGRPPFEGASAAEILRGHLLEQPPRPSTRGAAPSSDLESVLLSCLAKDPDERPTAAALRAALLVCTDRSGWSDDAARAWWDTHGDILRPEP